MKVIRDWWPAIALVAWLSFVSWWAGLLTANVVAGTVLASLIIVGFEGAERARERDKEIAALRAALQVERAALVSAEARAATVAEDGVRRAAILSGGHAIARYNLGSMYPAFGFYGEVPVEPHEFGQAEAVIDGLILLLGGARPEKSE
ncbi:hypothetical protein [Sphingomonas montanisoli]|uniref:Uncharacterized protein n=1 Tax=Sphingomonas montanisoli TaxID=2606412 RepID=A0A5D9CBC3_9SPHN|nr:hypothetical protein [Sphingomonas montanisoli]TZG28597.1 hypothetical protein FYJ91_00105 [Sphingomonas montanisoli]